jgi:hypothetical protein
MNEEPPAQVGRPRPEEQAAVEAERVLLGVHGSFAREGAPARLGQP